MEEKPEYKVRIYINIEEEEINIGIKDVKKAIWSLKNSRICGPESVCAEFLKGGTEKLYRILSNIIKQCLNGHSVSDQWKVYL